MPRPSTAGLACPPRRDCHNRRSITITVDLSSITDELLAPQSPKPKRKQIRPTASTIGQRRVEDLKAKRHKSDVHRAAVRLYDIEKQKPKNMSIRKVLSANFGKIRSVPKLSNNHLLHQARTCERIPNEDGSCWLISGHGIQVSMPGILEPYPNQSDEHVRRGQFKEGDDPDALKTVQHWNN